MTNELNTIIAAAGYTTEELQAAIVDKLHTDGVHLREFNDEQKNKIVTMYAATVLAV